jgi:hypothetical protein
MRGLRQVVRNGRIIILEPRGSTDLYGMQSYDIIGAIINNRVEWYLKKIRTRVAVSEVEPFRPPLQGDIGSCTDCGCPNQVSGVKCPNCGKLHSFSEWIEINK